MISTTISDVWQQLLQGQPAPPISVALVTGAAAVLVVMYSPVWRIVRGVITIAHEGGHAVAALLTGRRLTGIRLHSDTSGLTVSVGKRTGPGMVFTGFAGYVTPALIGLGATGLLTVGRVTLLLWVSIVLLVLMLVMIRNVYGVISVLVTGGALFAVSWFAPTNVQAVFAYLLSWFLLIGGVRPVFELQRLRWRGRAPDSDADQLARLTRVPAIMWVTIFAVVAGGALAAGGYLMLRSIV